METRYEGLRSEHQEVEKGEFRIRRLAHVQAAENEIVSKQRQETKWERREVHSGGGK